MSRYSDVLHNMHSSPRVRADELTRNTAWNKLMMSPDAVLSLEALAPDSISPGSNLYFFKNHQFACWDVAGDVILPRMRAR